MAFSLNDAQLSAARINGAQVNDMRVNGAHVNTAHAIGVFSHNTRVGGRSHPKSILHELYASSRELSEIREELGNCTRCRLCQTRHKLVFGDGDPRARVMIIGEAPGRNEDEQGLPFVGAAGKKLSDLLDLAGLRREEVYIANVIKCRPPKNRNPRVDEITSCSPVLLEQIRSIWPQLLLCLGNFSTRFILGVDEGVTRLHGSLHEVAGFTVMPTFHPAACMYHRDWQPLLEADLRMLGDWLREHPDPRRSQHE